MELFKLILFFGLGRGWTLEVDPPLITTSSTLEAPTPLLSLRGFLMKHTEKVAQKPASLPLVGEGVTCRGTEMLRPVRVCIQDVSQKSQGMIASRPGF